MASPDDLDPRDVLVSRALQDEEVRSALLEDPKGTIRKVLGLEIPDEVDVEVLEERPNKIYIVLPAARGELSDEELSAVAGGTYAFHSVPTRIRRITIGGAIFSFAGT